MEYPELNAAYELHVKMDTSGKESAVDVDEEQKHMDVDEVSDSNDARPDPRNVNQHGM